MKAKIINISIPERLLKDADLQAKRESRNRSELFREALRYYLVQRLKLDELYAYGEKQAKKLGIKPGDVDKIIHDYRRGK